MPYFAPLVQAYREQYALLGREGLNEEETRSRFIDNFFKLLGWDIGEPNSQRVRLEPHHKSGIPDYAFLYTDRNTAFFVEAKRASDPDDPTFNFSSDEVFQATRYAYSAGIPFVILTNFALTRVYTVAGPPDFLFPERWENRALMVDIQDFSRQIAAFTAVFERAAVDSGSLEKLKQIPVRGFRIPVTTALLTKLLDWRISVASGLLAMNPRASDEDLDRAATSIVDRILFSRILIDRELESDFLKPLAAMAEPVPELNRKFQELNEAYNGAIFLPHPADELGLPAEAVKEILVEVTSIRFPFDLAVLPIEILGDIYETFIGVNLKRHGAKMRLEPKEEVKKEKGVYFTPRHIVREMVDATVRRRISGATYRDLLRVKVLDPACGSGSFLVAAYQTLLSSAREWWLAQPAGALRNQALRNFKGAEVLSIHVKREILLNCIYGADIDQKALDIAALSLYLVLLDQDSRDGVLLAGTALPALDNNLVHGNSIVDAATIDTLAIDWPRRLPSVFERGGFDVVVANPPYIFGEWIPESWKNHLSESFDSASSQLDFYAVFLEKTVKQLCRPGGLYAYIVPDAILARQQREDIREVLIRNGLPRRVYHVGPVFSKVKVASLPEERTEFTLEHNVTGVSAVILVGQRGRQGGRMDVQQFAGGQWETAYGLNRTDIVADQWKRFLIYVRPEEWPLLRRLTATGRTLEQFLAARNGISRGEETGKRSLQSTPSRGARKAVIPGESIAPFYLGDKRFYIGLIRKDRAHYTAPKVLIRKTDDDIIACRETRGEATLQSVYNLHFANDSEDFALAILNSRLARWFIRRTVTQYKKVMPQITQDEVKTIPVPTRVSDYRALVSDTERVAVDVGTGLFIDAAGRFDSLRRQIEGTLHQDFGLDEAESAIIYTAS